MQKILTLSICDCKLSSTVLVNSYFSHYRTAQLKVLAHLILYVLAETVLMGVTTYVFVEK